MNISNLWLRLWSIVYRLTGWYPWWIRYQHLKHIYENIDNLYDEFLDSDWSEDSYFSEYVSLNVSLWQARHKFYRKFKNRLKRGSDSSY